MANLRNKNVTIIEKNKKVGRASFVYHLFRNFATRETIFNQQ